MRKYLFIIAFVLLLAPPLFAYWFNRKPSISEGNPADRLVLITANNPDIRNEFRIAFARWHQQKYGRPAQLVFLSSGGSNDIKRQLDTIYRQVRDNNGGQLPPEEKMDTGIQMIWGGGDTLFDRELKPLGVFRPLDLDEKTLAEIFPQPALGGVNLYDREKAKSGKFAPPLWVGTCLSSFGIIFNPDLYRALGLDEVKTWSDLTDPRLVGNVALADPTHAGSAAATYIIILQRAMADAEKEYFDLPENRDVPHAKLKTTPGYKKALDAGWAVGMHRLLLIAANARYFSDAAPQVPNDVAAGNAAAGMAIDFFGRVTQLTVGPRRAKFVLPTAATAITPDPIAILYGTHGPQLELANHFVEFILSPEGQRLWVLQTGEPGGPQSRALCRPPIRHSVYADRTGWIDIPDYFAASGGFNQRGEWMTTFSDIRSIWAAAWIDDRPFLRDAYEKILAIKDDTRRQAFLDKLADLPITRDDLDNIMTQRKAVEADPKQDSDQWKARQRIGWAAKFRNHYQQISAEAAAG